MTPLERMRSAKKAARSRRRRSQAMRNTVTLACPWHELWPERALGQITAGVMEEVCEADISVRVRWDDTEDYEGRAVRMPVLDEIHSPCGHALTPPQEARLLADAVETLGRRP